MRRIALTVLLAALLAPLLSGCARYTYRRQRVNTPVPEQAMEALVEGREMQQCLDLLGAPVRVWQDPRGIWLAYIWIDQKAPSLSVSVPTGQIFIPGPSLSYGVVKRRGMGVLLCFDNDLKLRFARRGLTDLPEQAFADD